MFISVKVMIISLIIWMVTMFICYRLGELYGSDNAYDMGYKACEKDLNYDYKLKFEFEEFLAAKGLAIDKFNNTKTLKRIYTNH